MFKNAPFPILVPGPDREGGGPPVRNLVGMDDDEHRTYRSLIAEWFLPGAIRKRKAEIEAIAKERIDALSKGASQIEFANVVSAGLPLRFINATLGIPPEDDAQIHNWTSELFGIDDELGRPERPRDHPGPGRERTRRLLHGSGRPPTCPTRRLTRIGAGQRRRSMVGPLPPDLLVPYFILLSAAGHDTVATVLAGGVEALARHPDQLARLKETPELIGNAVEEMMRWVTPTKHFMRNAVVADERGRQGDPSG